jgi:hypothetical protein
VLSFFASILGVAAFVAATSYVQQAGGTRVVALIGAVFVCAIWIAAHWYPWIPTAYIGERAYAYYRVSFIALSLGGVVASFVVLSMLRSSRRKQIIVAALVGFVIACGGGVIT